MWSAAGTADSPRSCPRGPLAFRTALRGFLSRSDAHARAVGVPPSQHQLLLAIRGHSPNGSTVGQAAAHLHITHHATVQLVDRAEDAGLVQRVRDPDNYRAVRLRLTASGAQRLAQLSGQHLQELALLEPTLQAIWDDLGGQRERPAV